MKNRTKIFGFIAAAVMICAGMRMTAVGQDGMTTGSGAGQDMSRDMKMSSADQKFMMTAAMGGMAEVEMARLALEKSSSDAVKQYAQKMIDDHTAANNELMQVASTKGVDMMYVKESGVKDHEKMEKLLMKESTGGKDMDAKAFAAKTLPVVRMHLQMARDMMMSMKGTMTGMSH
jgi:putative membrane protein